jgi:hypothetical protein
LVGREVLVGILRRHTTGARLSGNTLVDQALVRLARNERCVTVAIGRGSLKRIEAQSGHPFLRVLAMALETVLGKNGSHIAVVIKSLALRL